MALTTKLLGRLPVNRIISDGEVVARAPTTINAEVNDRKYGSFIQATAEDPLGVIKSFGRNSTIKWGVRYTVYFRVPVVCNRDVYRNADVVIPAGTTLPVNYLIGAIGAGTHIFTPQEG